MRAPTNTTAADAAAERIARLPRGQASLLRELATLDEPTSAKALADAAQIERRSAGQRLRSLQAAGLITSRRGRGTRQRDQVLLYTLTGPAGVALARAQLTQSVVPAGPTVYAALLAERARPVEQRSREHIHRLLTRAEASLADTIAAELDSVYAAGVADGFAQGVAAEAGRHQEAIAA